MGSNPTPSANELEAHRNEIWSEVRSAGARELVADGATLSWVGLDPVGDFARGRHDRLARAELESVGLRP